MDEQQKGQIMNEQLLELLYPASYGSEITVEESGMQIEQY